MKTLKPMVQFVKDTAEECRFKDDCEFAFEVRKHAQLLSQQPKIGMFVPAVCENGVWSVLEEPTVDAYMQPKEMDKQYAPYQQAKSKVIFKGWEVENIGEHTIWIEHESKMNACFIKRGKENINGLDTHTLEDLVNFNLEMV
jgi:hypothetical protein